MYKYIYVESMTQGMFKDSQHREIIDKYSKDAWRFVAAIPKTQSGYGRVRDLDLVFEKEE
jgi:hypothetical protein